MKEDMGGTCSSDGRGKKLVQHFGFEKVKIRDHLEDQGIDEKKFQKVY
jgi:hypothetical protein